MSLAHLGQARRIVVSDKNTTVLDGGGTPDAIAAHAAEIRAKLESADPAGKVWLERRLAQLSGGIAVIRVGGTTATEQRERKDRYDDAVGATRAAIESGFVPGGGLGLLKAQRRVAGTSPGLKVVSQACAEPLKQIAANAGADPASILSQTIGHRYFPFHNNSRGYDARAGEFTGLIDRGVIDPAKVVIEALRNATATAGMILTTEMLDVEL